MSFPLKLPNLSEKPFGNLLYKRLLTRWIGLSLGNITKAIGKIFTTSIAVDNDLSANIPSTGLSGTNASLLNIEIEDKIVALCLLST